MGRKNRTTGRVRRQFANEILAVEMLEARLPLTMYVGTNLDGVVDYGATAFVNVMNEARDWQTRNLDGSGSFNTGLRSYLPQDEFGWPLEVPFDPGTGDQLQLVHTVIPLRGAGTYTWSLEGTGSIQLRASDGLLDPTSPYFRSRSFDFTGGNHVVDLEIYDSDYGDGIGTLFMNINSSDSSDPLRNMQLILPGHAATHITEPFLDSYTDKLAPFANLRFMDWGKTNGNPLQTWDDRTTPQSHTQTRSAGVSLEYITMLANQLQQDAWFTVPVMADDNYVRNMARNVRDNLDANLKIFVEYSNETWNSIFSQTTYVQNQGEALGLDSNRWNAGQKYVSLRSVEIWDIFEQELGSASADRLVKVIATQASNSSLTRTRMNALVDPTINPTGIMPDALAIAPYFGGPVANQIVSEGLVDSITVSEILERAEEHLQNGATTAVANHKAIADEFGIWLIAYEGGQHLVGSGGNENNQTLTDKLIATNRDSRMYDLYLEYLDMLDEGGVVLHSNFSYLGGPGKYGSWGIIEDQDQPLAEAHKYRAITDWIAANPSSNIVPHAQAGPDLALIDDGDGMETVHLDGSGSRDFDGGIANFAWEWNGQNVGNAGPLDIDLPIGLHQLQLTVTDDVGATATDTITISIAPKSSGQTLVESSFLGTTPGLNQPWSSTLQQDDQVTFSGWSTGSGFGGSAFDDTFAFVGNLGNTGETDLDEALANDRYIGFAVDTTNDAYLDLRGAQFNFTIDRIDYHTPRRYAVMSSSDGFGTDHVLFDTGRFTTSEPTSFSFPLPFSGFATADPVEFRIYAFEGQYGGHDTSLTAFRLNGAAAGVTGRYVFYNNSAFDDEGNGFDDDDAIASNKSALLPGQSATFDNYTNYQRGLNGIMVDLANTGGWATAADFEFRTGNSPDPATWTESPTPSSVTLRVDEGIGGSDRVTIAFPDGEIQGEWLQVSVQANVNTGLSAPDVFFFGNAVGESGDRPGVSAQVDGFDYAAARDNHAVIPPGGAIENTNDHNYDGLVDGTDLAIVRDHATTFETALRLLTLPAAPPLAADLVREDSMRQVEGERADQLTDTVAAVLLAAGRDRTANDFVTASAAVWASMGDTEVASLRIADEPLSKWFDWFGGVSE